MFFVFNLTLIASKYLYDWNSWELSCGAPYARNRLIALVFSTDLSVFFFAESWRVNKGLQLWTQSLKLGTCNRYRTGNTYWIDDYQKFWTIHQSSHFTVLKPYQCNAKTTWALMPWAFTTRLVCSWGVLRVTHSIFTQVHTRNKLQ